MQVSPYLSKWVDNSMNFTWNELKSLDAGSWFGKEFDGQEIPRFTQVLEVVKKYNFKFIFDVYIPPDWHPHKDDYVELAVQEILDVNVSSNVIMSKFYVLRI